MDHWGCPDRVNIVLLECKIYQKNMDLKWYYTEGQLTLKVDSEEHKFSLEDLIASSTVYKERRKKIQKVFIIALLIIGAFQYFGGGLPSGQDVYFYVGYIATPVFFAGIIASVSYFYLKYSRKKIIKLDSILQEHLGS